MSLKNDSFFKFGGEQGKVAQSDDAAHLDDIAQQNGDLAGMTENAEASPADTPSSIVYKTVLDSACVVEGKLVCSGPTRLDGNVKGEVVADDLLFIDKNASVIADLNIQELIVHGAIKGNVTATKRITLSSTAKVEGDIRTPSLKTEEGALLRGQLEVSSGGKFEVHENAPRPTMPVEQALDPTPASSSSVDVS